jgi:hypothetical protein
MLLQPMMEKLQALKLQGMIEGLEQQEQDEASRDLSFLDRLALLIDRQWRWRQNQVLARRPYASPEGRCLRRKHRLPCRTRAESQCAPWVGARLHLGEEPRTRFRSWSHRRGEKLCGVGPGAESVPGWLFGLLHQNGGTVPRSELAEAAKSHRRAGGDWAMAPMAESERRDFWEIAEDRYQARSMILTSQLPASRWHEQIGDPTLADAIIDRLVHNAHRIEMRGESMRKQRGEKDEK